MRFSPRLVLIRQFAEPLSATPLSPRSFPLYHLSLPHLILDFPSRSRYLSYSGFQKNGTIDGRKRIKWYIGGSMCVPGLGAVLAIHLREVWHAFRPNAVARGWICDPAVEVEAARMMGAHGRQFSTGACLFVPRLLQARLLGCCAPKRLGKKHAREVLGADGIRYPIQAEAAVSAR